MLSALQKETADGWCIRKIAQGGDYAYRNSVGEVEAELGSQRRRVQQRRLNFQNMLNGRILEDAT